MGASDHFSARIETALSALRSLQDQLPQIEAMTGRITTCLGAGGTIYTAGNGGSAAEAMHLSEELIGRYRSNRQPHRAICLNADTTALTCIANDYGYEHVFSRQCQSLLTAADVLVVLSTSGNSRNLVEALLVARQCGATTIGLLGHEGGACLEHCDHTVLVPTDDSAHVQEAHLVVIHLICEAIEQM
jgi:D-sedoheptulose 7-phosphate isomerase